MLSVDDAQRRLMRHAHPTSPERVPLGEAAGRVLADPRVIAAVDVPPFANSAMDGFAIRAADVPGRLRLVGEVAAGSSSLPRVEPGTAARIMTGAPMPPGADSVVPIEDADDGGSSVAILEGVSLGQHVRDAAHDTRAGDEVCLPGVLGPAQVAVLASLGIGSAEVRRRPRVAVLSTGDELVEPGERLRHGQIHDANSVALATAVAEAGGEPVPVPRAADDERAIDRALADATSRSDLVVTSGGVSVGRYDHVRSALERRGSLDFWRVAVQPGKPLAVGEIDGTLVIGLPGNPVSALVTFELFVRPYIRAMLGLTGDGRLHVRATPTTRMPKDGARRAFLRVQVGVDEGVMRARPAGGQSSSQLRPMAAANALLVVPEGTDAAEPTLAYDAICFEPPLVEDWR